MQRDDIIDRPRQCVCRLYGKGQTPCIRPSNWALGYFAKENNTSSFVNIN
jgi:hypothetical protein